jgi:hypothetical protein
LKAPSGEHCGWLVGHAIGEDGVMLAGSHPMPAQPDAFEPALYRLGGHFAGILLSAGNARVYMDPAGAQSCVYAPALEMVGSTPSLVPYGMGCDDDEELIRTNGMPTAKAILGFGLTPRRGVQRLMPNHYLDLTHWMPHRHWPAAPIRADRDPEDVVNTVSELATRHIRALARDGIPYLALTAGYDSRSLLACAREVVDRIELVTLSSPDAAGRLDVEIARQIAQQHGLNHRVVPFCAPTVEQREQWMWRTGFSVSEQRGWDATGMFSTLDPARPEMVGVAGEAARASYWRELGNGGPVTPELILTAMGLPHNAVFRAHAEAWLRDIPADGPMNIVDLFYIEQRLGAWAGILPYAEAHAVAFQLYPFVQRDAMAGMLALPDAYKFASRFPRDIIQLRWPELARIPFNREPGLRHVARRLRRRVWLIRRALTGRRGA